MYRDNKKIKNKKKSGPRRINVQAQVGPIITTFYYPFKPPNYSNWIFTHLKLCLADAIHNFKWVKIIQIWQNRGQLFSTLAGWCHILFLTFFKRRYLMCS